MFEIFLVCQCYGLDMALITLNPLNLFDLFLWLCCKTDIWFWVQSRQVSWPHSRSVLGVSSWMVILFGLTLDVRFWKLAYCKDDCIFSCHRKLMKVIYLFKLYLRIIDAKQLSAANHISLSMYLFLASSSNFERDTLSKRLESRTIGQ